MLDRLVRATCQDRAPTARQLLDLAGNPLCLFFLVVGLEALDRPSTGVLGPELLVRARGVVGYDGVGGVEDQLRGTVVLLELDDLRMRVVPLELEDVADVGSAP